MREEVEELARHYENMDLEGKWFNYCDIFYLFEDYKNQEFLFLNF